MPAISSKQKKNIRPNQAYLAYHRCIDTIDTIYLWGTHTEILTPLPTEVTGRKKELNQAIYPSSS